MECVLPGGGGSLSSSHSYSLAPVMSGKTVSAVTQAIATRVKANRNPDFNKVLESRKNADILNYLNNHDDEEQKCRDFQVSFLSIKLKFILDEDQQLSVTLLHVFVSFLPYIFF